MKEKTNRQDVATVAALIEYFHVAPVATCEEDKADFSAINRKSVKLGWIIHPDCCTKAVEAWLKTLTADYNATFYKEWDDVVSKSRFELFVDQIRHYASTYGKLMEGEEPVGNGFVPNDGGPKPRFEELKVLQPTSQAELVAKCVETLQSGIALKEQTMHTMCNYFLSCIGDEATDKDGMSNFLSQIKNKEAQAYLSCRLDVLPADAFGMLRVLVTRLTGSAMLIKDRKTVAAIADASKLDQSKAHPLAGLTAAQEKALSSIFLRFKPLFLAMKTSKAAAPVVNRLRRLSVSNHRPFKAGFWETIVANPDGFTIKDVKDRLKDIDIWRAIRLMMVAREKMLFKVDSGVFVIRNGKTYVREKYEPKYSKTWVSQLYFELEGFVADKLREKACSVKFPEGYEIALPTSEKNFVGNFPYGTSFKLEKNNVVGVYWRNEWGTRDYDLSMVDMRGMKIGWNAWYYGGRTGARQQVIYSGDVTNANPEAVELLYIAGDAPDGIVKLNKFNGADDSKFRFFYGNEKLEPTKIRGRMIDPNNVKFDAMIDFQGQGEKTIGMLLDGRFVMMDATSGTGRVSVVGKYVDTVVEGMRRKAASFIPIRDILLRAGFTVWEPSAEEVKEADEKPGLDLTDLKKDTLIALMS